MAKKTDTAVACLNSNRPGEGNMAGVSRRQRFILDHRRPLRVVVVAIAAAALCVPLIVVALAPGGFSSASFSALRLLALYAFTLIFIEIVTGAMRVELYMLFNPLRAYRFHIAVGIAGFAAALAHGIIVLATRNYVGRASVWLVGPIALGLLCVTVYAALDKRRLPRIWRRIHQVNYLIFIAIFVKAAIIGTDVRTVDATAHVMRAVMVAYVVLAAVAVAVRLLDHQAMVVHRKKESASDGGVEGD